MWVHSKSVCVWMVLVPYPPPTWTTLHSLSPPSHVGTVSTALVKLKCVPPSPGLHGPIAPVTALCCACEARPWQVACEWVGRSLCTVAGDKYYGCCQRLGVEYRVGDVVLIKSSAHGLRKYRNGRYVGEIECMWEDVYSNQWIEARWYVGLGTGRRGVGWGVSVCGGGGGVSVCVRCGIEELLDSVGEDRTPSSTAPPGNL